MVNCLICGNTGGKTLYYFEEFNNEIVECNCGFIYSKLEERKNVNYAYENDYWTTYQLQQGEKSIYDRIEEFEFISDERIEFIKEFKKTGKHLDVGCSMGFLVNSANNNGFYSYGLDPNKECIDHGLKLYEPINISTKLLEEFKESNFDLITCFNVIEHLENPKKFFSECSKKLVKDGLLVIGTHDIESETHKNLGSKWKQITRDGDHLFYFSQTTLKILAQQCGFEVLKLHKPIDASFTIYLRKK